MIITKNINATFTDFTDSFFTDGGVDPNDPPLGLWVGPQPPGYLGTEYNTIYINQDLMTTMPESAIAAILAHEATHADYDYNPDTWATRLTTLYAQDPMVTDATIFQPGTRQVYNPETGDWEEKRIIRYTRTEEFFAFSDQAQTWSAIKGADADPEMDGVLALYNQGEAFLRAAIDAVYTDVWDYWD